jgi:cobyrinic acid a,c-diamide synthase
MTKPPTLIIADTTSGVGKTTISLAIMYALKYKKGFSVQPFKIGPDFIDSRNSLNKLREQVLKEKKGNNQ